MSIKIQPQSEVIASDEVDRGHLPTLHFFLVAIVSLLLSSGLIDDMP
jgi:hypothetical protein